MAIMGMNLMMLYTEDTYEIEDYPYFGYMRGRYSADEIKEVVAYGNMIGIETVPCIQTLGHLAQYIRWGEAGAFAENANVLLPGEERTYEFIEECIKTISENIFRLWDVTSAMISSSVGSRSRRRSTPCLRGICLTS